MGTFFICDNCGVVFRDPKTFLDPTSEKSRYDNHQNDITDKGFQRSVLPLVDTVTHHFPAHAKGLDYGSGNGPVAAAMLQKEGYSIALYDPFYAPDTTVLEKTYDFIICNEVMEHFYEPKKEFETLNSLLKPDGLLICGTGVFYPSINFDTWFYKNDPTHVIFYTEKSLKWIAIEMGFVGFTVRQNLVTYKK